MSWFPDSEGLGGRVAVMAGATMAGATIRLSKLSREETARLRTPRPDRRVQVRRCSACTPGRRQRRY
jgi:hypothetical protein